MSDVIKTTSKKLNSKQISFLENEFNRTKDEIKSWNEEKWDEIYDALCEIEISETPNDGEAMSEHCKIASELVTLFGNAIAKAEGTFDEEEFENELKDGVL